ncbi:MAG: right-handed parallel beta-helix repeat-containing protein [Casimicrobiaceae bacterium]
MRKCLIRLSPAIAAVWAPVVLAVTISGTVTLGAGPFAGAQMLAPKATCTASDALGNYACQVPANWSGTLAPYSNGWTFVVTGNVQRPAAATFTTLGANQSGVNFTATAASGLRAELTLRRPASALFYLDYNFDGTPDAAVGFGSPSDVALVGDVNGDGISDLVLFRNGTWYASTRQDGTVDMTFGFGAPGDVPLLCDFDGDGTSDLVLFRNGTWYVSTQRNGVVDKVYHFGQAGDVPLCGDFDGDGIDDVALFRNGIWYIDTNRDGAVHLAVQFGGVAGEIPVALDFDGDGRTDIGVFRNGIWYFNGTLDGASAVAVGMGAPGDVPLGGHFNRANTRFVKAGNPCTVNCTQANPYGTITAAWQDAIDGDILRIAKGTYPEALDFSYPGAQYAPGKFGKNNIKLIGVSKYTTIVSPTAGDALYLRGASGYSLRGLTLRSQAAGARGLVLAGGINSVLPTFPGPQVNVSVSDFMENNAQNALLTGTSNAWFRYVRLNRSRAGHGISVWGNSYVRVVASEISSNGYTVPVGPPVPDAGKGFDIRESSEGDLRRSTVHTNLTFGIVAAVDATVRLASNTIDGTGVNGISVCGPANNPDTSIVVMTNNWVAGNGFGMPTAPGSGMEIYVTCSGTHTITGNAFVGNALNGLFVGSGNVSITNNLFQTNAVGVTLYVDTTGFGGEPPSYANTVAALYGNTFDGNARVGIYPERHPGTVTRDVFATVGGTGTGQKNFFRNYKPPIFHAIGCLNVTTNFACPLGGNFFDHSGDDVSQPTCNTACVSTP